MLNLWIVPKEPIAKPVEEVVPEKTAQEIESEQGLGGFATETVEALWQRWENIADIKQRFDVKIQEKSDNIRDAFENEGAWAAFCRINERLS